MLQVFISYASLDGEDVARSLAISLEEAGLHPWLARESLGVGVNYAREIPEAIAVSDVVVVLLTPAALHSGHVAREVDLAISKDIRLIPVFLHDLTFDTLPSEWQYWLRTVQITSSSLASEVLNAVVAGVDKSTAELDSPRKHHSVREAIRQRATPTDLLRLAAEKTFDPELGLMDLTMRLSIKIDPEGSAELEYDHLLLNLTGEPRGGLPQREVWFEHTARLSLETVADPEYAPSRVKVIHDAGHIVKFIPRFLSPLAVGDSTRIAYRVAGGSFVEDHYWAQSFPRYTAEYECLLETRFPLAWAELLRRDARGDEFELPTGCELLSRGDGALVRAKVSGLAPNETVTLRWGQ